MTLGGDQAGAGHEDGPAAYDQTWLDQLCAELDRLVLTNARNEFLMPATHAATEAARTASRFGRFGSQVRSS